jgi:purine nucleosidase
MSKAKIKLPQCLSLRASGPCRWPAVALALAVAIALPADAQKRMVLIDEDGAGPGGSNQMAMMVLLQSPQVEVLGITMVTGDAWRDEETAHTLRMLELIGRTDVPVAKGAVFPLVRTEEETRLNTPLLGQVDWLGAWGQVPIAPGSAVHAMAGAEPPSMHAPDFVPPLPEGAPHTKAIDEDAPHFLIRQVHDHPHEVTIYAGGPLTNIALAIRIDAGFAELTKGIVLMGGSLNPQTDDPEFAESPRHEFNFWFDPEAAHIVLRAPWPRIDVTTVDVSIQAPFTQAIVDQISRSRSPAARYIAAWSQDRFYMWDELAACAWLDPSIITKEKQVYMDVDLSHGPNYGNTLTWSDAMRPAIDVRKVHAQLDLDLAKFTREFVELMTRPPQQDSREKGY